MHAISSYRGNRPKNTPTHPQTHKRTHKQDRLQYTAPQLASAQRNYAFCPFRLRYPIKSSQVGLAFNEPMSIALILQSGTMFKKHHYSIIKLQLNTKTVLKTVNSSKQTAFCVQ